MNGQPEIQKHVKKSFNIKRGKGERRNEMKGDRIDTWIKDQKKVVSKDVEIIERGEENKMKTFTHSEMYHCW